MQLTTASQRVKYIRSPQPNKPKLYYIMLEIKELKKRMGMY